ncbi:hypothetical protein CANCADRAFT_25993 [Tortispora caseinolytica NRRL Y-17796]|uniref:Dipeptidyl-peptidase IV n=1 Tax=Tortispora caseinolytica NRRL Y-17796 TaxID=767744 RepID=A0A1E4THU8_9ASCO|nr:hypothetical protein CANCADRAFT_25993 [Tortispora caseinolytica NRRL Y-17796]
MKVAPSMDRALLVTNYEKQWRHSYSASYFVFDLQEQSVFPLANMDPLMVAEFDPTGKRVAYVRKEDKNLYLHTVNSGTKDTQITTDGGTNIFYGIPDWVYEEEVFAGNSALWWSTDGTALAYLRTDDTDVLEYTLEYFAQKSAKEDPYPEIVDIKYPKPGSPNPLVSLHVYNVADGDTFEVNSPDSAADDIITEVVWLGPKNVMLKQTNRASDLLKVIISNVDSRSSTTARVEDVSKDGGWFEISQFTRYVPASPETGRADDGYIDTVNKDGYLHLALFSPVHVSEPAVYLTSGNWEVVNAPSGLDLDAQKVYFISTEVSPVERHLYSVFLNGTGRTEITDSAGKPAFIDASFSPSSKYALVRNKGPSIPKDSLVSLASGEWRVVQSNKDLRESLAEIQLPEKIFSTIEVGDGYKANVVEMRPPNFDASGKTKYPLLFKVYGGPGSQTVSKEYSFHFEEYMCTALNMIVVSVDGRGTGYMGREFRTAVRDQLGKFESQDQIAAGKNYVERNYIDANKTAIWGWSYGGYMTLKTLETDGGKVFKYGMAVAPVTDWRLYDSIYTERYMHEPKDNEDGYDASAITNVESLKQVQRFLMMHGTGDDNVHFQNSIQLVDKFDLHSETNYDMYVFPDSDHSIRFHNANSMVFHRLADWFKEKVIG